jgi:hypothetical protein
MRYIIRWNTGYGDSWKEVEAGSEQEATDMAYVEWREEAENQADYGVEPYTEELAEGVL